MILQPVRIDRLFSRRSIILSHQPTQRIGSSSAMQLSTREFRTLGRLIAYGEPARFELADSNFIDECSHPQTSQKYWPLEG